LKGAGSTRPLEISHARAWLWQQPKQVTRTTEASR